MKRRTGSVFVVLQQETLDNIVNALLDTPYSTSKT